MERFVKGDVVVVPFPFSDLSFTKKRPALVLAASGEDIVLAQITSKAGGVPVMFSSGGLPVQSYVKPHRLFSADTKIVLRKAGRITSSTEQRINKDLIVLFNL